MDQPLSVTNSTDLPIPVPKSRALAGPVPSWHMDVKSGKAEASRAAFPHLVPEDPLTLHAPNAQPEGLRTGMHSWVPSPLWGMQGGKHTKISCHSHFLVSGQTRAKRRAEEFPCPGEPPEPTAERCCFSLPVKSRVLHQSVGVAIFNDHFTSHARKALRVVLVLPSHLPGKGICKDGQEEK